MTNIVSYELKLKKKTLNYEIIYYDLVIHTFVLFIFLTYNFKIIV